MASTYSTSLRLELMATGDQSGTWGDTTNTNLGTLLEQAITGVLSVAQGDVANLTLTSLDGASDQARNAVVNLTGAMTAGRNVVVPTANKLYLIKNSTTGGFAVTVKTTAGSGVAVAAGTAQWVYCDGTNVVQGLSGTMAPQSPAAVAITGGTMAGVAITGGSAASLTSLSTTGSTAGFVGFQTISTEAAAAAGPILDLYRNSASPLASDVLGQVLFNGKDSAGNVQEYASVQAVIIDPTSTSEDSSLEFYVQVAGARTKVASFGDSSRPITKVVTQVFAASGTYTPTAGMVYAELYCLGAGAGGGGTATSVAAQYCQAAGGGSGGYSIKIVTAAMVGASQTVTIGAAGAGGATGNNAGGAGGDTSIGTLCVGKGAAASSGQTSGGMVVGGPGGVAGTGDVTGVGGTGGNGTLSTLLAGAASSAMGNGANSPYGGGGTAVNNGGTTNGGAATGKGAGGAGGISYNNAGTASGGNGSIGYAWVIEYVNA